MRINNNIMALNAHRQLGINQASSAKSMEKLSSGFRINRAGDDAAGLAISEKMRGQIRGLKQASRNAQDGISLIQTAEGALNETHSILQRMRELAVQSATDTNTNKDRAEIQKEIDQLTTEVTRISGDTQFNTMKLLNGEYSDRIFHIGANAGQKVDLSISDMGAYELGVKGDVYTAKAVTGITGVEVQSIRGEELHIAYTAQATEAIGSTTAVFDESTRTVTLTLKQSSSAIIATNEEVKNALESAADAAGINVVTTSAYDAAKGTTVSGHAAVNILANSWVVDSNATKDVANQLGINVSAQTKADDAIKTIDEAIVKVSGERSKLGAMQNRLEHTIANLGTSAENLQAAESRIRDLDMADEIMAFTKNSILQQAATAMLAQANMAPQSVLQLLG